MEDIKKEEIALAEGLAINLYEDLKKKDSLTFVEVCLYKISAYFKSKAVDNVETDEFTSLMMYKGIIECLTAIKMFNNGFFKEDLDSDIDKYINLSYKYRLDDDTNIEYAKEFNYAFKNLPIMFDDCMLTEVENNLELKTPYGALNVALHPNDLVFTYDFLAEFPIDALEYVLSKQYIMAVVEYNNVNMEFPLDLDSLMYKNLDLNKKNHEFLDLTMDITIMLEGISDLLVRIDVFNGKGQYIDFLNNHIESIAFDKIFDNYEAFNYKLSLIASLIATEYYTDTLFKESDRIELLMLLSGNTQARLAFIYEDDNLEYILDDIYPILSKYITISRDNLADYFLDDLSFLKEKKTMDEFVTDLFKAASDFMDKDFYYEYSGIYLTSDINRYNKLTKSSVSFIDGIEMVDTLVVFELKYLNSILDDVKSENKKCMYELKRLKKLLPEKIRSLEELINERKELMNNM